MTWPLQPLPRTGPYPRDADTFSDPYHVREHNDLISYINELLVRVGDTAPKTLSYADVESRLTTRSRASTFVVAPYDAPDLWKEAADFVLTGPIGAQDDANTLTVVLALMGSGGGGTVLIAPGTVCLYQAISILPGSMNNVNVVGSGIEATRIRRKANITSINIQGTSLASLVENVVFSHLTIDSDPLDSVEAWTSPGILASYATGVRLSHCKFGHMYGPAFRGYVLQESSMTDILFDHCGTKSNQSTHYAALSLESASTTDKTTGFFGSNLRFTSFNEGAIWITGVSGGNVSRVRLDKVYMSNSAINGSFVKVSYGSGVTISDVDVFTGDWRSSSPAYSTVTDIVNVTNSDSVMINNARFESNPLTNRTVRTFLRWGGSNKLCGFNNVSFYMAASTNAQPTVACVEYSGTNSDMLLGVFGITNHTATLVSGAPTTTNAGYDNSIQSITATTSTTTVNVGVSRVAVVTLQANTTLNFSNYSNLHNDVRPITIILKQDGTGNRVATFQSAVWEGGVQPQLDVAANAVNVIDFIYDGTSFYGMVRLAGYSVTPVTETSDFTIQRKHVGLVELDNSSTAIAVTVPTDATLNLPIGSVISLFQLGTGVVTLTAAGGVTILSTASLALGTQYQTTKLRKRAANSWVVF